jgi:hypothetical protein
MGGGGRRIMSPRPGQAIYRDPISKHRGNKKKGKKKP